MERERVVVGVDEAGRGPVFGPVCVGALSVRAGGLKEFSRRVKGIRDSKKMSARQRALWLRKLKELKREGLINFSRSFVGAKIIDERGIAKAVRTAVSRSLRKLSLNPKRCLILLDGSLRAPEKFENQKTIIGGDDIVRAISSASVVAKESRDAKVLRLAKKYPGYGLEKHKGYGSREHFSALRRRGLTPEHRRSFLSKSGLSATISDKGANF